MSAPLFCLHGDWWSPITPESDGSILLHQKTYTHKLLRTFNMDSANALSTPMIGRVRAGTPPGREVRQMGERARNRDAQGDRRVLATELSRPE